MKKNQVLKIITSLSLSCSMVGQLAYPILAEEIETIQEEVPVNEDIVEQEETPTEEPSVTETPTEQEVIVEDDTPEQAQENNTEEQEVEEEITEEKSLGTENDQTGVCGPHASWSYHKDTEKLVISGTGEITDPTWKDDCHGTIQQVEIQNGINSICDSAFTSLYHLESISIPNSVVSIGKSAFENCYMLSSITLPSTLVSIGNYAFFGCSALTSINIPATVTSISNSAFASCPSLKQINVDPNNPSYTFQNHALYDKYKVTLIKVLNPDTWSGFDIPYGVTRIDDYAFSSCYNISNVNIPNTVTSIGGNVFYFTFVTSITLPTSITKLDKNTFNKCPVKEILCECTCDSYIYIMP